jgi:hypothetical protein
MLLLLLLLLLRLQSLHFLDDDGDALLQRVQDVLVWVGVAADEEKAKDMIPLNLAKGLKAEL